MTKLAEEIKCIFLFIILYSFFFYMGMRAAKSDKKHNELQKRYTYTDNELDKCVKRNLELRRK